MLQSLQQMNFLHSIEYVWLKCRYKHFLYVAHLQKYLDTITILINKLSHDSHYYIMVIEHCSKYIKKHIIEDVFHFSYNAYNVHLRGNQLAKPNLNRFRILRFRASICWIWNQFDETVQTVLQMVYYSNLRQRRQQKCKFNILCLNLRLCFPMFVTDCYANHIFVVYMLWLSHLKQLGQNNVKHLCYTAEALSQASQVTRIQQVSWITYIFQQ